MTLSLAGRRQLLSIAREAIAAAISGQRYAAPADPRGEVESSGAFVTLRHRGELRGCIGQIEALGPTAETVAHCAVSAATRDPRFPVLTLPELRAGTEIEISLLTPLQRVGSVEDIEVGRDGLLIEQGRFSGLLLPQVATEWGWDRDTFLAHTCRKAGLPDEAWKRGAEIYRFQAEIFSESTVDPPPG